MDLGKCEGDACVLADNNTDGNLACIGEIRNAVCDANL
jgi:hypothetical protein